MNLSHLYYFKKLAETQHYTRASKELFITQPSLSSAIAALEKELGVSLFQKKGRNVELTKYGKEFLSYVTEALNILDHGIASIKDKTGLLTGTVDIGCIPTLLGDYLPNLQEQYMKIHPFVQFNTYYDMSIAVAQGVACGKYDLGFCSMVDNTPDLNYIPIGYQEIVALVSKTHPLAEKDELSLKDLSSYKLITYRQNIPIGKVISELLANHNLHVDYSYDDEISIGGKICTSSKIALVADTSFLKQFDNIKRIHLVDVPLDTRLIYMTFSKENFLTPIVEDFSKFVLNHGINLP